MQDVPLLLGVGLEPGFTTGTPARRAGMRVLPTSADRSRAARRAARRARRGRRCDSTIDAAPTTTPPAASATCIVSRVEPPVVTTSSTTRTRSPARSQNRGAARAAVLPLREHRADAERTTELVADHDAAERRREHDASADHARAARRAPRPSSAAWRDAEARARTADSRCCAVRTRAGNGLRAMRPIAGRARAPGRDRVLSSFFHGKGASRAPGRSKRAVVYNPSVLRKLS